MYPVSFLTNSELFCEALDEDIQLKMQYFCFYCAFLCFSSS